MRLHVYMGTREEFDAACDCYTDDSDIRGYYRKKLAEADEAGLECLDLKSIEPGLETSEAFRIMGLIEEAILVFFRDHDKPADVRIVCTDEETARLYKVVYNFRFADSKESRMEDDHWD